MARKRARLRFTASASRSGSAPAFAEDQGVVEGEQLETGLAGDAETGFAPALDRNVARPLAPGRRDHGQDRLIMGRVEVRRRDDQSRTVPLGLPVGERKGHHHSVLQRRRRQRTDRRCGFETGFEAVETTPYSPTPSSPCMQTILRRIFAGMDVSCSQARNRPVAPTGPGRSPAGVDEVHDPGGEKHVAPTGPGQGPAGGKVLPVARGSRVTPAPCGIDRRRMDTRTRTAQTRDERPTANGPGSPLHPRRRIHHERLRRHE